MKKTIAKAYQFSNSNFHAYQLICENISAIPDHLLKTLLALSKFMSDAYPTITTISTMVGKSKRSIMRDIKSLERLGIITVKRRHRQSSVYNLGDTMKSLKDNFRVTPDVCLGDIQMSVLSDTQVSPHHIKDHINKHIKEKDFKNKISGDEILERKMLVEESKRRIKT